MWKKASTPKPSSIRPVVSIQYRRVTITDGHTTTAYTALAWRRAVNRSTSRGNFFSKSPKFGTKFHELDYESLAVIGNNAVPVGGQYQQCWCNLPPFRLSFSKPYNSISISSGFGTKFRKEVGNSYFYEYQNFLIGLTLCRTGGMKLVCPKPARFVHPFR